MLIEDYYLTWLEPSRISKRSSSDTVLDKQKNNLIVTEDLQEVVAMIMYVFKNCGNIIFNQIKILKALYRITPIVYW